jgi:uncharacterized protein with ParB-like and HNH nuclease domain
MKPTISNLGAILYSPSQYVIPVFQRHYRWEEPQWEKLWENLTELRQPGRTGAHFMGFLVFVPGLAQPGRNTTFHLVDGQQRLTTLSILLIALRNRAREHGVSSLADEIHNDYLVHHRKSADEHFRLFPKASDKGDYIAAIKGETPVHGRIGEALRHFEGKLDNGSAESWEVKLQGLFDLLRQRLEFMCATLEHENAYNIFKSLNSTGVPLGSADLIRNFVFMHVRPDDHDDFDRDLWRPLEARFHDADKNFDGKSFSDFFRDFLMRGGRYVRPASTFDTFEERYEGSGFSPVELTRELSGFADYYEIINGWKLDQTPEVTKALAQLNALESSTTYPLLLNLFHRRAQGNLSDGDLVSALEMLSGFILRRFICGESSRGYGQLFVKACDVLAGNLLVALRSYLESKGWPDLVRFKVAFLNFNLYQRGYGRVILEALEAAYAHKEPADLSNAEIEHIMPQTLSEEWARELGVDAEKIHGEWLHTPGNLTLSAYNQELWNNPFAEKRPMYAQSNIVMNRKLADCTKWGSEEIKSRGNVLAEMAAKIWAGPVVPVTATDAGSDTGDGRGRRQAVLSVVIDWKHTGHALEKETICESVSSGTLAKVLARLVQVLGAQVLERCSQISSARGPLVSQDPSKDFLIQATGQTYQNQPVAGTQWHVLTNNSTDEKVELLNAIPAHLGYPREMLFVDKITRGEALLRMFDV